MTRHVKQVNLPQNVPAHVIYLKDLLCPASRSQPPVVRLTKFVVFFYLYLTMSMEFSLQFPEQRSPSKWSANLAYRFVHSLYKYQMVPSIRKRSE